MNAPGPTNEAVSPQQPRDPAVTAFGWLRWLPWAILLAGAAITWQQHLALKERVALIERTRFDIRANEVALGLERRLQSNADLLRGVAGLFAASDQVDRDEFKQYVEGLQLERHYPGIQGIGFSQWLSADQLPAHEAEIRGEGFTGYAVHPPGKRDHYSAIVYLEPFDWRNQRAFGFDMFTEGIRQEAMRRSVETGEAILSGKVTLVQETDEDTQAGFLIYLPVYTKHIRPDSTQDRWSKLMGWAYSPVRARDLVQAFLRQEFPALSEHVALRLYASGEPSAGALLYDDPRHSSLSGPSALRITRKLSLHGSQWLLEVEQLDGSALADSSAGSRGVLWGGAALTLALAALAQVILRSHRKIAQALRSSVDANRRLASSQAALRLAGTVMNASPLGIFVTDAQRQVVSVNPAFARITGFQPGEVIGKQPEWFLQTQHAVDLPRMWDDVEHQGNWAGELDCRRKDGSVYPQRLAMTRVTGENGQTENCVGLFQDITEQRKAEANIRRLAHHDYLTGLPNRALLVERATQELLAASRYGHKPVILFIDLDRFKPINDAHGHETGDEVLVEVARRLGSLLRETDLVCRQGGDEFVVLLPDHHTEEGLISLAQKLLDAIETPYTVKGRSLELTASIGIAIFPEHGDTVDKLIQNADAAMYQAKAHPGQKIWLAGAAPETESLVA